jgi:hypothetical protein
MVIVAAAPLPSLPPTGPAGRGPSNNAWAFNVQQTECADAVGLLSVFVEWALSSLPKDGGDGSGSTISRSALAHLAGMGRVNSANYSTCLHRLAWVVALPVHPSGQDNNNCNGSGLEQSRGGPGCC